MSNVTKTQGRSPLHNDILVVFKIGAGTDQETIVVGKIPAKSWLSNTPDHLLETFDGHFYYRQRSEFDFLMDLLEPGTSNE